jgi:hypothetical protein
MPALSIEEITSYSRIPLHTFVETGTWAGDTVRNVLTGFKKIYSIELGKEIYENTKKKFIHEPHVTLLNGDSSIMLEPICKLIDEPTFFWLDGHYSGCGTAQGKKDVPLFEEISQIVEHCKPACVVAIDDVRLFGKKDFEDWSEITVEKVLEYSKPRLIDYKFYPSSYHPNDRLVMHFSEKA